MKNMKEIDVKMKEIGIPKKGEKYIDDINLNEFSIEPGGKVFTEYRYILEKYDVKRSNSMFTIKSNEPSPISEYGYDDIVELYTEDDIKKYSKMYKDRIMDRLVPIGEGHGGDLICVDKEDGYIYYWYHEDEYYGKFPEGGVRGRRNIWIICIKLRTH